MYLFSTIGTGGGGRCLSFASLKGYSLISGSYMRDHRERGEGREMGKGKDMLDRKIGSEI